MSGSNQDSVKRWLMFLRSFQVLVLLASTALITISLAGFAAILDYVQYSSQSSYSSITPLVAAGVGVTSVALVINLVAVALCITWLVYTLSPARREKANCCGNHNSCIIFRHDVGWDIAFAVLFGFDLISSAVQRSNWGGIAMAAVMMVTFIATAVLSSKMGRAAKEQQEVLGTPAGFAAAAAAPVSLAAPPKVVEIV